MKTNEELQKDVQDAIKFQPLLQAAEIGVIVKNGIVTLTGVVDGYFKKTEAENAAKNVVGVKAVVENITIKYNNYSKTDSEIAEEVLKALNESWSVPKDKVQVKVENGWVTLEGELPWNYQREAAKSTINYLQGVKGIANHIKIKSEVQDAIEKKDVEKALERHWSINADDIHVKAEGSKIILTGNVTSLYQKEEAGKIAWNTPGVWTVDNKLEVEYDYSYID
ncbi:BON domain-containing protein [Flavobacterium turcicum]|uniref:BON domain-containing protein n=1 Tax=Flavobacterium turcicum TaxID=2764718 RepID=A0ABR7JFW6_9FLAO|nr:BON domain-containing protein [Flavobacterium turcicum]MBC5863079.1 BON domain-containing protein [Flavobacterium turcicum]NHL01811.1 BON domain-containing protein [Flavobacterium turcicum]